MKIYSLHPDNPHPLPSDSEEPDGNTLIGGNAGRHGPNGPAAGHCHDCHSRARWIVTFGGKRPQLRLCDRCAKYLAGFLEVKLTVLGLGNKPLKPTAIDDAATADAS